MTHGWHSKEMMFGNYYVDGFAIVDGRRIIYEYNGCAYHSCEKCRPVRVNENEDARKAYFKSLPNTKIVEIASCEWYSDKCEMNLKALKSEISPLLYKKIVSTGEIMRLVARQQIYGFAVVDLEKSPSAKKWARLNYPPIMQKMKYTSMIYPNGCKICMTRRNFQNRRLSRQCMRKNCFYIRNF